METVAIVGAGTMGRGIAQVVAGAEYRVLLYDPYPEALTSSLETLKTTLEALEHKGKIPSAERLFSRITPVNDLTGLAEADWIIEAVPERLELKRDLFAKLDEIAPEAVFCTNTSTLSVTSIAGSVANPARVLGLHFFNPAPLMKLVEIIPGLETDGGVLERTQAFVRCLGKEGVVVKDSPGFIVNRVARPYYGEALKLYGEGVPVATIDRIMRGLGFRMGPFELLDLIGLDVNFAATKSVYEAYFHEPRYRPHPIQQAMVEAGYLGKKSGRGFYRYPQEQVAPASPKPEDAAPQAYILGSGKLAEELRAHYPHTDMQQADFILDARVGLEENLYKSQGLPVVTLVWAHSVGQAMRHYERAESVAGFSVLPPFLEGTVAEIYTPLTGENAASRIAERYFRAQGLETVTLRDSPGGVAFRVLAMLINEAVSGLSESLAEPESIDSAMRLGTNYPLGPLEWSSLLGLESVLKGLQGLFEEFGEDRYRPQPLLKRAVATGLGDWRSL